MKTCEVGADTAQRQPAAAVGRPPSVQVTQGGAQQADVDQSPRMASQRRGLDAVFGAAIQRQDDPREDDGPVQARAAPVNETGMPDQLKAGLEGLSGMDLSDVRVHRNSGKPAQLHALAYAQGSDIHLGPGQEQHLPHESWHVVQQRQGRVQPSCRVAGVAVNDDPALESEADRMGAMALRSPGVRPVSDPPAERLAPTTAQRASVPAVAQCTKVVDHGKRADSDTRKPAAPFQLAAVQFNAEYDIGQYAAQIKDYCSRVKAESVPVIELRMYDAALPDSVVQYLAQARKQLTGIVGDGDFDLVCSILRDETLPQDIDALKSTDVMQAMEEFAAWLKGAADVSVGNDAMSSKLVGNQSSGRRDALDPPAARMLEGRMMIPLEEAFAFAALPDEALQAIYEQTAKQRYSLHQRLLAKVLLLKTGQRPKPVTGRLRRNSAVRPDTVTVTNLVTGSETDTLQSTLAACKAAFQKGGAQVYLIVEARGDNGSRRAKNQIEALRSAGLVVELIEEVSGAKGVQQSGVMLDEPGDTVPARIKIRVTPQPQAHSGLAPQGPSAVDSWLAKDKQRFFDEYVSRWSYTEWYRNQVHPDIADAYEFWDAYYPQYLDSLCETLPQYVVQIRNLDPGLFARTYPRHQQLYEKQMLEDAKKTEL